MADAFPARVPPGAPVPIGSIVTLPRPELLEVAALAGCDWVLLDCEHGSIADGDLPGLLAAAPEGIPVLVRVAANVEVHVKHALDAGAAGVVCPSVPDAATARSLVRWARYPPAGARSVGIGRASGYGLHLQEQLAGANEATTVVLQVETVPALADLDAILAVDGVGGVLVGPYDLSASMGVPGCPDHPDVAAAVTDVCRRCRDAGVPVGLFFGTGAAWSAAPSRVLDFVALGVDVAVLAAALRNEVRTARGS